MLIKTVFGSQNCNNIETLCCYIIFDSRKGFKNSGFLRQAPPSKNFWKRHWSGNRDKEKHNCGKMGLTFLCFSLVGLQLKKGHLSEVCSVIEIARWLQGEFEKNSSFWNIKSLFRVFLNGLAFWGAFEKPVYPSFPRFID